MFAGPLASAIALARTAQELPEEQLGAIFATEEDRVDTAHVLAEILLPMLSAANEAAALQRGFSSQRFSASHARNNGADLETESSLDSPSDPSQLPASNTSPMLPGIADFIDEMLTQDSAPAAARNPRRPA